MKKFISFVIMLSVLLTFSCKSTVVVKAPPGQVKKVTKTKSAKPFAPGQQKKKNKKDKKDKQ